MQIAVTRVFAKFINDTAKEMGFEAHAQVVELPYSAYTFYTGTEVYDAMLAGDYKSSTGVMRAIRVTYPGEYYACPRYLTTPELTHEFRKRGVSNVLELRDMLRELLEI